VGRHSASRSSHASAPQHHPTPARSDQAVRRTRAEERAFRSRPIWRRSPVIPAAFAVFAVWGGGDAYHLFAHPSAATVPRSAPEVGVDLSALAGQQQTALVSGSQRVSRNSRSLTGQAALKAPLAKAAPARPSLPRVNPDKTVLGVWVRPSAGGMSSCFCERWGTFHEGIDLAGPLGSPIVAAGDGVVLEAGPSAGFGHWILIQHSNGDVTIYGHMYTVLVSKGEHVTAGEHIADIGSDGQSTGPHLHFGVRLGGLNGPYIDPVPWLKARGVDVGSYSPNA
jgi:murein DD-endopeptidase MepM/ murein hydrolase activator NlpD